MPRFSSVLEAIQFYGTGARVFNSLDASECSLLCEIGKRFLHTTAEDLVRTSDGKAVLYEYFGDGTPMRIKVFFNASSDGHHRVRRVGSSGVEFYCQAAFLRTTGLDGKPIVRAVLHDPRVMDGKKAPHAFSASIEFFPLLPTLPHIGYKISHYGWDRAQFAPLRRFVHQYHELYWQASRQRGDDPCVELKRLKSWVVCTGCALHDVQNSFCWSMRCHAQEDDALLDDLFIVIESVRNSYKELQLHLLPFLQARVTFRSGGPSPDQLRFLWVSLAMFPMRLPTNWQKGAYLWRTANFSWTRDSIGIVRFSPLCIQLF